MKKIFFLGFIVVGLLAFSFKLIPSHDAFVLVRLYEVPSGAEKWSKLIVTYPDSSVIVDLPNLRTTQLDSWVARDQRILATINKLKSEGYHLVSSTYNGMIVTENVTTFVLEK